MGIMIFMKLPPPPAPLDAPAAVRMALQLEAAGAALVY